MTTGLSWPAEDAVRAYGPRELRDPATGRWISYEHGRMSTRLLPAPGGLATRKYSQADLADDVRRHGVQQPIALRHNTEGVTYVNGKHRAAAAIAAGVPDVPVIVQHSEGVNPAGMRLRGRRPAAESEFAAARDAKPATAVGAVPHLEATDYEGQIGNAQHVTRVERGTMPTSAIAHLRGVSGERPGEHTTMSDAQWGKFRDDVARHGITNPIFITVDHDQEPRISEGNNRRDAAVALGMAQVPVLIRYFGHAERQGTVWDRARRSTP